MAHESSGRSANVTLGQLRTFVAVADLGSVRLAASRLSVTQSAVSAAVAALQRELGTTLLAREGRGLRLTAAGDVYAGYAREVLGLLDEASLAATSAATPDRGRLRLAAVTTAGEHLLPGLLAAFRRRHPQVEVTLEVGTRERVWTLLRAHEADLAVAGRPPQASGLRTYATLPNHLVVVAAPGFLATGQDVRDVPWLLREPGSGTRDTATSLLESLQADPPLLTLGSNGAVIAGAAAGLGVTLVSREAVRGELTAGRLVELAVPGTPLLRPWHLVAHRDLPPVTRSFAEHVLSRGGWVRAG